MMKQVGDNIKAVIATLANADPSITPAQIKAAQIAAVEALTGKRVAGLVESAPFARLLTRSEVAAILKKDKMTVSRYARAGKIKRVTFSTNGTRGTMYTAESVRALLEGARG